MKYHILLLACLVSQGAWAGWSVTYKDAETGEQSQEFYENGKANFGQVIYTGRDILVVDQNAQAYWKGTPQKYCDALRAQRQKMESHMAALPAKYRPVPISKKKVTRKKLGTETIAGYTATGYEFYVDGSQAGRVWVSSDPGVSGIIAFEKSMSQKMKCLEGMDSASIEGAKLYKQTVKGKFVLKESHREVAAVENQNVPSGNFAAPSGYQAFADYEQFFNHISKRSNSSSRSAAPASETPLERPRREARQEPDEPEQNQAQEDNVVVKDAKEVGHGVADEARQTTKRGIRDKASEGIQKGVKGVLDKWF